MDDRYRLDGKVAVVTGCASGVGESVAKLFTERGSKVLAVDVNADGLESAMDGVEKRCHDASRCDRNQCR